MDEVRVAGASRSLDGLGAGWGQDIDHPFGRRGPVRHAWSRGAIAPVLPGRGDALTAGIALPARRNDRVPHDAGERATQVMLATPFHPDRGPRP